MSSFLVLFIKRITQIPSELCTLLQDGSQESRYICEFYLIDPLKKGITQCKQNKVGSAMRDASLFPLASENESES